MDHFFALCATQVSQHAAQELRGKPPWSPLYPRSYARIIHGLGFDRGTEKAPHQVVCHGLEGATQVEAAFTCASSKFSPWIRAWIYIILFCRVESALYGDPDVIFISKTAPMAICVSMAAHIPLFTGPSCALLPIFLPSFDHNIFFFRCSQLLMALWRVLKKHITRLQTTKVAKHPGAQQCWRVWGAGNGTHSTAAQLFRI